MLAIFLALFGSFWFAASMTFINRGVLSIANLSLNAVFLWLYVLLFIDNIDLWLPVNSFFVAVGMLFVQRAHEITHLPAQHAFHRPLLRRHHMNFDVAGAKRRGGLQSDEACPNHNRAARALGRVDDGAAIGERTQRMNMR